MSAPMAATQPTYPVPSFVASVFSVAQLEWKRLWRGAKARLALGSVIAVVLAITIACHAADKAEAEEVMQAGLRWGFFRLLVFLLPLLLSAGTIAEEVEARTLSYLTSRPVARPALALGKFIATAGVSLLLVSSAVLLLHLGVFITEPSQLLEQFTTTLRSLAAVSSLTLCYSAIAFFWGAVATEAAGLIAAIHLAVLEFGASFAPSVFRFLSANYWAQQLAGFPKGDFLPQTVPDAPLAVAAIVPIAFAVAWLAAGVTAVATSEYRFAGE